MIRLPYKYYEFSNCTGESNECIHAGSYHRALDVAKIHPYNIIAYSSIMPGRAKKVTKLPCFKMGTVIEGIFAQCDGEEVGKRLSAGVAYRFIKRDGKRLGGIAVERTGDYSKEELISHLEASLDEIRRVSFRDCTWDGKPTILTTVFTQKKKYGTAFAGLVFVSFKRYWLWEGLIGVAEQMKTLILKIIRRDCTFLKMMLRNILD